MDGCFFERGLWYIICVMSVIEDKKRRQMLKVILAEAVMLVSVVAIVVVATLAAMGFFVGSDGSIEQSGLVQIHSMPTGASVTIDGGVLFARTNLSRTVAEGEHAVKIARDGYDEWDKTIKMRPGILLRLYYPRLFLLNRQQENVQELGQDLAFYAPSEDRTSILYAEERSTLWQWLDVKGDEVRRTELDMANILPGVKENEFFGRVEEVKWSANGDHVITKVSYEGVVEWISVNLRDLKNSLNLTRTFGMDFSQVEMADGSAGKIFVLENQHLRRINTGDQEISRVLLEDIASFMNEGGNIIYSTVKKEGVEGDSALRKIGVYRDGEKGSTTLTSVPGESKIRVAIANYYGEVYLGYTVDDQFYICYGNLPTYNENEADFSGLKELLGGEKLAMKPESLSVSPGDGYFVAKNGKYFAVVGFETTELYQYEALSSTLKWLDDDMFYTTQDEGLTVWDFDNTNRRELVRLESKIGERKEMPELGENNVDMQAMTVTKMPVMNYDVTVANNNKWMYYVVKTNDGRLNLVREKIRD